MIPSDVDYHQSGSVRVFLATTRTATIMPKIHTMRMFPPQYTIVLLFYADKAGKWACEKWLKDKDDHSCRP
jgi:hypothetical protein